MVFKVFGSSFKLLKIFLFTKVKGFNLDIVFVHIYKVTGEGRGESGVDK